MISGAVLRLCEHIKYNKCSKVRSLYTAIKLCHLLDYEHYKDTHKRNFHKGRNKMSSEITRPTTFGTCLSSKMYTQHVMSTCQQGSFDRWLIYNVNPSFPTVEFRRYKNSKKYTKRPEYYSDSDSDVEEELAQGTKLMKIRTQSLRLDGILKKTLGMARNKVETAFYEGNIRVNGKKANKKSFQLKLGDEVDLIRGVSPMNPEFLTVSRVEIISVNEDAEEGGEDQLIAKVKFTKNMCIENYDTTPWKKGATSE